MELIGLTKAVALTTLTFTLSATASCSQTNENSVKETPILYSPSESNRDSAIIHYDRGAVYYNQKKWDLALAEYNKAIRLNSNLALAYSGRGMVYFELGDINKAKENFQIAAQLFLNQGNTTEYEQLIRILNLL